MIAADSLHTYASYRYGTVNVQRYSEEVSIGHAFPAVGTVAQSLTFDQIASIHESELQLVKLAMMSFMTWCSSYCSLPPFTVVDIV